MSEEKSFPVPSPHSMWPFTKAVLSGMDKDGEIAALKTTIQQYQVREAVLVDKISAFKKYASHRPGQEAEFFRYLADRDKGQKLKSADDAVWATVADAVEALASLPQAEIPISDQDPEKLRAEERERILGVISGLSPYDAADNAINNNAEDGAKEMKNLIFESLSNQERID